MTEGVNTYRVKVSLTIKYIKKERLYIMFGSKIGFYLKKAKHFFKKGKLMEIWYRRGNKKQLIGTIYSTQKGIKIISKYLNHQDAVKIDESIPFAVAVYINFKK